MYITCFIALCSCKKENSASVETVTVESQKADSVQHYPSSANVKIESFAFPAEVNGCACYFAANKEDFENEKYIYIDDYGNNAFLQVNGKPIKIEMEEGDFDPSDFKKTIKNSEFTITIEGKKIKEMTEVMMFSGIMTVTGADGSATTTPIYGECGC